MEIIVKISVKESIISGDWLQCYIKTDFDEFVFRLRPISFEKILTSAIDNPHHLRLTDGVLVLLKIEIVNVRKTSCSADQIMHSISLFDQDGFMFNALSDPHLTRNSTFSLITGLRRFREGSPIGSPLQSKIKAVGALAFLLPGDDQAEYFFSVKEGSIQAVESTSKCTT